MMAPIAKMIAALCMSLAMLVPLAARAEEPSALVAGIQKLLGSYGYNAGPADGVIGKRTLAAIVSFEAEFRVEGNGQPTPELAAELGDPFYQPQTASRIYVLNKAGPAAAKQIAGKSHAAVLNLLADWEADSRNHIDMRFERPKATIFVVDEALKPGDIVMTQIEVIRKELPKYYENFYYEVTAETPTEPMIIINESEAGWELQLTHRLFVNGVQVAQKRTRAAP